MDEGLKDIGTCLALVTKVQNTVDGGFRITLDISSDNVELAAKLLKAASNNDQMYVSFVEKPE